MKNIKLSHILFSLALIAALALAAVPAPAYAMSASGSGSSSPVFQAGGTFLSPVSISANGVVCHRVIIWRNGIRRVYWLCHRVR